MSRRRVVITGFGALTPVGLDAESSWRRLLEGTSGVGRIQAFDPSPYPSQLAGEVKEYQPPGFIDPKEARRLSRFIQFALTATHEAIERARLDLGDVDPARVGVLVGTGIGSLTTTQEGVCTIKERGGNRLSPFFLPTMLPNMAAGQLSKTFGAKAYSSTIITACAAGAQAIGEASEVIRRCAADVMIACGTEASICETGLAGFCAIRALSQRNHDPAGASRPFEADRDGMVPAEGAATLILEEYERARARGAPIYAELAGYGCSSDAYHMVAPDPEGGGAALAIAHALEAADLPPGRVDYVNAHATSTVAGDLAETRALKSVFGQRAGELPISSTKSMLGHSMGASGAIEAVVTLLTIRDGLIHPTINQERPDPECDLDYVPNEARAKQVDAAISDSFGFGGQNVVLVFRRCA
ncbi:MAG TPA: beta-ketoacyl-ACP synthase II [Chloroflexota bacterium]|nr:beta-ketoacyl-ACP synthase II [Chloroflexota bacterium]